MPVSTSGGLCTGLEIARLLADGPALVAIDHLGQLLERIGTTLATQSLSMLRAEHQREESVDLLLVGYTDGHVARAMRDPDAALYRAGQIFRIERPNPQRFIDDAAVIPVDIPAEAIAAAAELADGAPAYVSRIIGRVRIGTLTGGRSAASGIATEAWDDLRRTLEPQTAASFSLLSAVHRSAPLLVL
jgi:hypothetical protein